jgi:hypothetical protein
MPSLRADKTARRPSCRVFVLHFATCLDYHVLIAAPVPSLDGFTIFMSGGTGFSPPEGCSNPCPVTTKE